MSFSVTYYVLWVNGTHWVESGTTGSEPEDNTATPSNI